VFLFNPVRLADKPRSLAVFAYSNIKSGVRCADTTCTSYGMPNCSSISTAFFKTIVPVLGVPVQSRALSGQDSLLSIAQMPGGIPVGTLAIGEAGAKNAGILAAQIIANEDNTIKEKVAAFRAKQTQDVLDNPNPAI
jgi:phosphoribosylcarboxyaminoimidazole (NCAIR) mutase